LMVGDGPLRHQVEVLAEQEGMSGRILLTGIRRDIPRMMAAMDLFMITSLWEGLPRVVIQAMCMKLPIVGFRIDGLSEVVRHELTGFLTTPRDLAQMAVYCGYLLENANRRQEMGKEGHSWVSEDFNLPGMIRRIESLYAELLEKKI